jgi:ribosomal protein S21
MIEVYVPVTNNIEKLIRDFKKKIESSGLKRELSLKAYPKKSERIKTKLALAESRRRQKERRRSAYKD